jgi:cytochrome c oxidase cbb3-type subunit III
VQLALDPSSRSKPIYNGSNSTVRTLICLVLLLPAVVKCESTETALQQGKALFRSNCAFCHGPTGLGGRGPNLHGTLNNGERDADIEAVIKKGVPGSAMPAFLFEPDEMTALVKFIKSLRGASDSVPVPKGDKGAGKRVYETRGCSGCHQIGDEGSTFGPNLTRVGAARSFEYLRESVLTPSADIPDEVQAVAVVTGDGRRYTGIRANEDSFTLQLRLPDESFKSFRKDRLKALVYEKKSLMPPYQLDASDLDNLLAYLSSLRGAVNSAADTQKAQGVH